MKHRILTDFFFGNNNPSERQFDRHSEYGNTMQELDKTEHLLTPMLNDGERELLTRMISLQTKLNGMTAEGYFIDGMRTGFQLAIALLDEDVRTYFRRMTDGENKA